MICKIFQKITFLTPWHTHTYHGVRNVSFSENFANQLTSDKGLHNSFWGNAKLHYKKGTKTDITESFILQGCKEVAVKRRHLSLSTNTCSHLKIKKLDHDLASSMLILNRNFLGELRVLAYSNLTASLTFNLNSASQHLPV